MGFLEGLSLIVAYIFGCAIGAYLGYKTIMFIDYLRGK